MGLCADATVQATDVGIGCTNIQPTDQFTDCALTVEEWVA
jgi:hypothetical protein